VLDKLLADGLVRVVLIHHPPLPGQASRRRGLQDAAALEGVLQRSGAELVLHGHNHLDMQAVRTWSAGRIPVVGVASASAARVHGRERLGRYNLFRFEKDACGPRITLVGRGLASPGGPVVELERRVLHGGDEQSATVSQQNLKPRARQSVT
jgi:3',5'-cyclic AMP phosphodiesterase CpdA